MLWSNRIRIDPLPRLKSWEEVKCSPHSEGQTRGLFTLRVKMLFHELNGTLGIPVTQAPVLKPTHPPHNPLRMAHDETGPNRLSTVDTNDSAKQNEEKTENTLVDPSTDACDECGGDLTRDETAGEVVCSDCGLIVSEELVDQGPEWRAYNKKERDEKARTGSPLTELRHDRGLSTNIDWKDKDAYGNQISAEKREQMNRLRKWDFRAKRDSSSNNIAYANGEIKRIGSALSIPKSTQETAASLYREAFNNDLIPGRSIEAMATASLYISLRIHNEPRSVDELETVARVDKKPLQRAYRYICRELGIGLEPADPSQYVPRFATKLNAPQEIVKVAEDLITDLNDTHHVSGNAPTVLAAAALYAAGVLEGTILTQADLRSASNVTEVSIRKNYEMFLTHSPISPITEKHIDEANTPRALSEQVNENVTHHSPDSDPKDTAHTNLTVDDSTVRESTLSCPECNGSLSDAEELLNHFLDEHDTPSSVNDSDKNILYTCPVCPRITDTFVGLIAHVYTTHAGDNLSTDFPERYTVDKTVNSVRLPDGTNLSTFSCGECSETFETDWDLCLHQVQQHDEPVEGSDTTHNSSSENDGETMETTGCSYDCESPKAYPSSKFNFSCLHCDCVFDTCQGLWIHMGYEHPDADQYNRESYAVDSEEHPVCTAADLEDESQH